jgi:hypothetical protein
MESTNDCGTSGKWRKARVSYEGYQEQQRRTIPSPTDVLGTLYAKILSVFDSFRRDADVIVVVSPMRCGWAKLWLCGLRSLERFVGR